MTIHAAYQTKPPQDQADGWLNVWAIEADVTRKAGDSIAFLLGALGRGLVALARLAVSGLKARQTSFPVRVAAHQQHVELAARNDDRAAA